MGHRRIIPRSLPPALLLAPHDWGIVVRMQPRISAITLGVSDLPRARRFYEEGLGWRPSTTSNEHIVFFDLGGTVFALFSREQLADDAKLAFAPGDPAVFGGFTLAHNVKAKPEVDLILSTAVAAGARLLKPAADTFWGGYSGYFADPDGHAWEVGWNPHWPLTPNGQVLLPD